MSENRVPVIAFYSYKGGSGRSLAAMQFAACLAHFGKHVVLIDLDLDSPSLHHKLAFVQPWIREDPIAPDGVVGILRDGTTKARELGYLLHCRTCKQPVLSRIETPTDLFGVDDSRFIRFRPPEGEGLLSLLVAGLPTHQYAPARFSDPSAEPIWEYWRTFYDRDTQTLFNHGPEFRDSFVHFIEELKAREKDGPDYILVDSCSGNSPLSHVALEFLADRVVVFTCRQQEGITGTAMMLSSIRQGVPISVVVSKIPSEWRDRHRQTRHVTAKEVEDVLDDVLTNLQPAVPGLSRDQIFVLRLDPYLSYKEHLPISLVDSGPESPTHSVLVEDYLALFAALLNPEDSEPFSNHFKSYLETELEETRLFHLLVERGFLINPSDESRNVALRADTLGSLMQILASKQDGFDEKLLEAGLKAAESFTDALVDLWGHELTHKRLDPLERIRKWCEFDSTVGFGRFSLAEGSTSTNGEIVLKDNFLLHGRKPEDRSLCAFWIGYLTTVLRGITGNPRLVVTHPIASCGQYNGDVSHTCIFCYSEESEGH